MKKRQPEAKAMAEHVPDDQGRCIVCGQFATKGACPGIPAEEEVSSDFKPPSETFLPASQEYDPTKEEADEFFDAFTHNPDRASFNVLCPICGSRPCLPECKLGPWTAEEIREINNSLPPLLPEGW